MESAQMLTAYEIVSAGLRKSTKAKIKQTRALLAWESILYVLNDPESVPLRSSDLVLNLSIEYSGRFNSIDAPLEMKSRDTVTGLIAGLHCVYQKHGHVDNWMIGNQGTSNAGAHCKPT